MSENAPGPRTPGPNQLLIEFGPVAIFVATYNILLRIASMKDQAVYIATGVFIVATLAAIAYTRLRYKRVPPVLIVTGVIVTGFGLLTIALHDEEFIKIKPTFSYMFYAAAILFSLLIRQNIWKLLFRHIFTLPDRIWTVLAVRWAGFFVFMAIVNEIIRRTQDTDFWVNSRLIIVFPLILVFSLANTPLIMKHMQNTEEEPQKPEPGSA